MPGERRPAYQFGPYRLDVAEQRLLHEGRVLPLTPKVFDVLRVLVQNSGHLVEKERLLAEVWNNSFVEEGALSRSISILRKTLGENGSEQKYIETVPKRGYRFIALVTECTPTGSELPVEQTDFNAGHVSRPLSTADTSVARPPRARHVLLWVAAVAGVLIAALLTVRSSRLTSVVTLSAPVHRQVTFTGREQAPTVSPDGRRIAYVSYERPEKKLVVQELAGGPPLTIFTAPEIGYLRWSPDGTELIVWLRGSGKNGVYVMPQLGGTPRRIASGNLFIGSWSPDGSTIAVVGVTGRISFFDKRGREQRSVSLRGAIESIWDIDWSAKGVLTLVSSDYQGQYTLWTIKPDGSEQRRLVAANSAIPTARWAPGSDAIYYLRKINQTFSLLKIPFKAGPETQNAVPTTVIAGLESDRYFALSGDGRRLVYGKAPYYSNLWLVEAKDGHSETTGTLELTHGTFLIERPSVSPDGASIVFNVGHEPTTNLHTMPITGGPSKQLTSLNSLSLGAVWSADGKQIAFASRAGGQPRVWAVDSGGGVPRALSSTDMSDTFDLTWSPGSPILYHQSGNRNYYQLDADTRSEKLLIEDSSIGFMFSPVYSPDGRRIAVMWNRRPKRGIWVIDAKDGRQSLVYPVASGALWPVGWSPDGRSIYAIESKNLNFRGVTAPAPVSETITEARVVRVPVNGDPVTTVVDFPFEEIGGVSMTPDGRRFVCAVYTSRSDVWVVDNFDASP